MSDFDPFVLLSMSKLVADTFNIFNILISTFVYTRPTLSDSVRHFISTEGGGSRGGIVKGVGTRGGSQKGVT